MSKGFCIVAQNNSKTDYVKQAYILACSILQFNKNQKICLITDKEIDSNYKNVFQHVVLIDNDKAIEKEWKIDNRWQVYNLTPFDETIVLDADMIILEDVTHWWSWLKNKDLYFTSDVYTYRNELIDNNYYRQTFTANNLPNIYSACYYFKKNSASLEFFKLLEIVMENWKVFYNEFAPIKLQNWCSIDVSIAITCKILGRKDVIDNTVPIKLVHMKPKVQGLKLTFKKWKSIFPISIDENRNLFIGNFKQQGIFHYVEDDFLDDNIIQGFKL